MRAFGVDRELGNATVISWNHQEFEVGCTHRASHLFLIINQWNYSQVACKLCRAKADTVIKPIEGCRFNSNTFKRLAFKAVPHVLFFAGEI